MNTATPTKKILLILTLVSIVVIAVYGFMYYTIYTNSKVVSLKIQQSSSDFEKSERIRLAKAELAKNSDFISKIDSYFISKDGVVSFINEIETLGKGINVETTISSIEPVQDTKDKNSINESLRVKLEIVGTWSRIAQFLYTLENLPYRIAIDTLQIKLTAANDALQFTNASSTAARTRNGQETWKAVVDFTILKLK